jgi:hypothetical protein
MNINEPKHVGIGRQSAIEIDARSPGYVGAEDVFPRTPASSAATINGVRNVSASFAGFT